MLYARENFSIVPYYLFLSSNTSAVNVSSLSVTFSSTDIGVLISTYGSILHSVTVNKAGSSSLLDIWDTSISTTAPNARKIAGLDTTSKVSFTYDVLCASGIAINNQGSPAADISVMFRER